MAARLPVLAAAAVAAVATAAGVAAPAAGAAPTPLFDAAAHRETLLSVVDAWNGGALTPASRAGNASAFHVTLHANWTRVEPKDTTAVAQARGIYINVEAAAAAATVCDARAPSFVAAVKAGVQALNDLFRDPADGAVVYLVHEDNGTVADPTKDGYANVHSTFALASAVRVLDGADAAAALEDALEMYEWVKAVLDDGSGGGLYWRAGDPANATRGLDPVTHWFEALQALWDVLPAGAKRDEVAAEVARAGTFLVDTMAVTEADDPASAYLVFNYKADWTPSDVPYTRANQWTAGEWASTGHGVEIAWLLSRAEQRGLAPAGSDWLAAGDRLVRHCEKYAIDDRGLVRWEEVALNGSTIVGNPDNDLYEWWPNSEAARTYVHHAVTRGRRATAGPKWRTVANLLNGPMTDPVWGGWFRFVTVDGLAPEGSPKWDRWKVAYHFAMLHAEVLRLAPLR